MASSLNGVQYVLPRENEQLSKYGDTKSARNIMLLELKKLIEANPLFRDKLTFPPLKASRLRTLINQRYVFICSMSSCVNAFVCRHRCSNIPFCLETQDVTCIRTCTHP